MVLHPERDAFECAPIIRRFCSQECRFARGASNVPNQSNITPKHTKAVILPAPTRWRSPAPPAHRSFAGKHDRLLIENGIDVGEGGGGFGVVLESIGKRQVRIIQH
jgi:hypothetical protein